MILTRSSPRDCQMALVVWAGTWQNQQSEFAPSEDSDQPGHPPSLIRVFTVRMKKDWFPSYPLSAHWRFWSDLLIWVFAGRTAILLALSRRGSFVEALPRSKFWRKMWKWPYGCGTYYREVPSTVKSRALKSWHVDDAIIFFATHPGQTVTLHSKTEFC